MSDLVERLRRLRGTIEPDPFKDAADELDRLTLALAQAERERSLAAGRCLQTIAQRDEALSRATQAETERDKLSAEIAGLREALEFYAVAENWRRNDPQEVPAAGFDCGRRAIAALATPSPAAAMMMKIIQAARRMPRRIVQPDGTWIEKVFYIPDEDVKALDVALSDWDAAAGKTGANLVHDPDAG